MWTVTGRRSPSRSPRCRPGCAPPLGCGRRSRPRWRTAGTSPRSLLRIGCRGRQCNGRSSCTARSSWSSRSRRRCWGWTRPGFGRPRWLPDGHHDGPGEDGRVRWKRTDPWETGFVDITGEQALLGQVDGRTSAAVQAWLAARTPEFRAGVQVVVIDPHAGYAAAVRAALPDAAIAVDHFHLVMLANKAVTAVRQRVNRVLFDI